MNVRNCVLSRNIKLFGIDDTKLPFNNSSHFLSGVQAVFDEFISSNIGSIMVAWDNGCGLNVVLDEDVIEIIGK